MQNIANVVMDGNLTADPELRKTPTDKTVVNFRIAANHEWGSKNGNKLVSYIPVECWEKLAENCSQYLRKGNAVTVQGELREDRWTDTDGKNHSKIKILARSIRFDYRGKKNGDNGDNKEAEAS